MKERLWELYFLTLAKRLIWWTKTYFCQNWANITWIIHLCGGLIHSLRVEHSAAILNGSLSDALTLTQGVPQGSILGPVIFSLHINNLPLAIPNSNVDILYLQMTLLYGRPTGIYYISSKTFRTVLLKQGVGSP